MNIKQITDFLNRANDWLVENLISSTLLAGLVVSQIYLAALWMLVGNPGFFGGALCGIFGVLTAAKINGDL